MQSLDADELAVIALGSNLPGEHASVQAALEAAVEALRAAGLEPVRASRWWRSAAWPDPGDPPFLNGVVLARTKLEPRDIMQRLHAIETRFGRVRGVANAPRPLDLDLIAAGRAVLEEPDLAVPHPRAADRYFVMGPLAEIAPDWRHPVSGMTARALSQAAQVGRDAAPQ
jgi:2-amino-4-hydroxy-6-hydroxymethyldihydropteridine diphosphokinase